MLIRPDDPLRFLRTYLSSVRGVDRGYVRRAVDRRSGDTRVDISQRAVSLQAIVLRSSSLPEVREQLVAEMQARIGSGTYQVFPEVLAENILRATLIEHFV